MRAGARLSGYSRCITVGADRPELPWYGMGVQAVKNEASLHAYTPVLFRNWSIQDQKEISGHGRIPS